ncbi:hypothetical protein HDE_01902 [Halotydeus destructor]|nr:hypothetical protein HDE_01902 [Halotydeus destructor]
MAFRLSGFKLLGFGGGFVCLIGAVMYPIYWYPMQHATEYRSVQKVNRANVDISKTQPADLTIWSDPFKKK